MNSMLEKESMAEKVQMVYFDPPYGIKYGGNFQPFVNQTEVTDGKDEHLSTEPEMIKAFRDTWELGIHSYLKYLRDRLLLVRDLLRESGTVYVQMGDENVHKVAMVMDEVFGAENRIATISFTPTGSSSTAYLPQVADYLLMYAKDKNRAKYQQLYESLSRQEKINFFSSYVMVEEKDGTCRKPSEEERFDPNRYLPKGARIYKREPLSSQGSSPAGRSEPFEWNGHVFHCGRNRHWSVSHEGLRHLGEMGRLDAIEGQALMWKRYEKEVPGRRITNMWPVQMRPHNKRYVVETSAKVIQRCLLMATDPGDLVLDITCGSGTTAYVAEQFGRRWITCDTSRVSLALAKQRLMTASFDYYKLAYPDEGIGSGFKYKTVEAYSPKILADNASPREILLYDQPLEESSKARITGPFTVEAVPAPYSQNAVSVDELQPDVKPENAGDASVARSGETLRQKELREELLQCGVRTKNGQKLEFSSVEPLQCSRLHAIAEIRGGGGEGARAVISFGPKHAPLEPRQVGLALNDAEALRPKPKVIIFVAFQFDPEAAKDIDETNYPGVTLLKVQANTDLQTKDLKKKQAGSESFWLMGQPDVNLQQIDEGRNKGKWQVEVLGFDYFNPKTGTVESGGANKIAVWMLDTDYDGRSLYPRQVFFPMSGLEGWDKLARNLKAEIDKDRIDVYAGTVSLPFELSENQRVAVKIIDDRGIESLKIVERRK